MSEEGLQRALSFLDAGHVEEARPVLIAVWQARRSARLAELIELLDVRSPDELPEKLRAIAAPRAAVSLARLEELDAVDDPRLGRWAIDALLQLPFTTPAAESFLAHIVDTVLRVRDMRLIEHVKDICETMRVRLTRKPMRDALIDGVERAVKTLSRTPPRPPSPDEQRLEDALDAKLAPLRVGRIAAEAFLAEIYASPADDDPRRVYADWLLERGDPRGEFIALQLQRSDVSLDPARARQAEERERELLKRHGKTWLGTLAPVISFGKGYARSTFQRGFLSVADIILSVGKKLEPLWDDPAWSTVEELDGSWPMELLDRAPLRGLRRITRTLDAEGLRRLARRAERLACVESIMLGDLTDIDRALVLDALPGLREIQLILPAPSLADITLATSLGARRLTVHPHVGKSEAAIERFTKLVSALENAEAKVDVLALTPPYQSWPRPAPVMLHQRDGRYVRAPEP